MALPAFQWDHTTQCCRAFTLALARLSCYSQLGLLQIVFLLFYSWTSRIDRLFLHWSGEVGSRVTHSDQDEGRFRKKWPVSQSGTNHKMMIMMMTMTTTTMMKWQNGELPLCWAHFQATSHTQQTIGPYHWEWLLFLGLKPYRNPKRTDVAAKRLPSRRPSIMWAYLPLGVGITCLWYGHWTPNTFSSRRRKSNEVVTIPANTDQRACWWWIFSNPNLFLLQLFPRKNERTLLCFDLTRTSDPDIAGFPASTFRFSIGLYMHFSEIRILDHVRYLQ